MPTKNLRVNKRMASVETMNKIAAKKKRGDADAPTAVVMPLYEGTFSVGLDKEFHPIGRGDAPATGALKLSIQPFLIREEERLILFDTGIGDLFGGQSGAWRMRENLDNLGLECGDITDIFLSHLHFDHIAGLAHREHGTWELTFPNATIYASERGWQSLVGRADSLSDEERAFVYFVDLYGDFSFLSNEENHPLEHVRTLWIGGHTHDHLALFYENGPQKFLMAGDVIGSKKALMRKYRAVYDADAEQGMEVREELKQLAWKEQYTILAYHETDSPMMRLSQWSPRSGYSIEVITV